MTDRDQVEYLKHWNIHTVDQLAQLDDLKCQRMGMGMVGLRNNAALFLEQARAGSGMTSIMQERNQLKGQVDTLTEQLADLSARMTEMANRQADGGYVAPVAAPQADLMQAMMEKLAALEARVGAPEPPKNRGGRPRKPKPDDHSEQAGEQ
jgi:hypothetical protein